MSAAWLVSNLRACGRLITGKKRFSHEYDLYEIVGLTSWLNDVVIDCALVM